MILRARIPASGAAPRLELEGEAFRAAPDLACFYDRRGFAPAWSAGGALRPGVDELLAALAAAADDGLRPEDYRLAALQRFTAGVRGRPDPGGLADLDFLLTDAFLAFAGHLRNGKVNPREIYRDCALKPDPADLATVLEEAVEKGSVRATLAGLAPPHRSYRLLRDALGRYRRIAARGGPEPLAPGPNLRTGDQDERVAGLRTRLAEAAEADGDAGAADLAAGAAADLFDDALAEAVRRFQARHGLEEDGVVGPATLGELNQRAEDHVRQIELNLERWRWLPRDLGRRHVLVNIAGFHLAAVEEDRTVLEMRVIVGKPYTRTPMFSSEMKTVVLNPYWNVPESIARNEIRPKAAKDPSYLARGDYEVLSGGRIRQRPGPHNALGLIKFLFPNRFNVYLHDTPSRSLFSRTVRTFSHGCIRIEKPLDLAVWVLGPNPRWPREEIEAGIAKGGERQVPVPQPVWVHVAYWTAWVDEGGVLRLGRDVYGRDAELAGRLAGRAPAGQAGARPPALS